MDDITWTLFPSSPINNKEELLSFIAGNIYKIFEYNNFDLNKLKSLNYGQVEMYYQLLLTHVWGNDYRATKTIKDSIKLCYSPNSFFGPSTRGMNEFINDLRGKLQSNRS